jgi:hypothetical protein
LSQSPKLLKLTCIRLFTMHLHSTKNTRDYPTVT